ncbi:uncharacterized protein TM35_000181450 [Trypanosoma theileri]|uniref:Guanine nucleotide-binding protein subunit beta-like protein n=1 Tax=Trypanosoma theileri TaxID=67003 RepID=A0A1X0NU73_9TRYP|nr:uncharacterized protein TM35_000181450 [Trypanosoma theileri]ORC88088.1 hypothetical protein TM35_000181450 [Trypanosoma theileri]
MGSFAEGNNSTTTWSSLFLPIEDEVMFASFTTLFSPLQLSPSQEEQQEQQQYQPSSQREGPGVNITQFSPKEKEDSPLRVDDSDATRSPLFALCGERADAVVCVLENRQVVFFDLKSEVMGPREVRRLNAMKNLRGCQYSKATCASLIPLDICYMCRAPAVSIPSAASKAMGDATTAVLMTTRFAQSSNDPVYLRGVVGSTDGRVDVFSEHSYVFGFVAHDSPVVAVSAICSGTDNHSDDYNNININNRDEMLDNKNKQLEKRRFEDVTANMGFVTCGSDGVVYVWKRQDLYLKPQMFDKSAFFSRTIMWYVVQPCSRDWMLSGMGNARESLVVHTTPGLEHELRVRSSVTFEDVEPRVLLPGSCFTRTTALAANNEMALVARGRDVFAVTLSESQCDRIFTAQHTVTGMYMANRDMAAATCDNGGLLYVLTLRPVGLLGCYHVQCGGPIRSVSMHTASRLITVVGGDGTVEVARMPDEWESVEEETNGSVRVGAAGKGCVPYAGVMDSVAAARVLHSLAQMQRPDRTARNEGEEAAAQESLWLARMGVPEEANVYLHRTAGVV